MAAREAARRARLAVLFVGLAIVGVSAVGCGLVVSGRAGAATRYVEIAAAGVLGRPLWSVPGSAADAPAGTSGAPEASGPPSLEASTSSTAASELPAPLVRLTPHTVGSLISGPSRSPVPILMYHVVESVPARTHDFTLYVKPRDFIAQLEYLNAHGYQAVSLQQVYDFWHGKGSLPAHPVVLSFDDGYPADFAVVAPLLNSLHWPGVLNLIAGRGAATRMPTPQVRAMVASGWEIDSHTVSHVDLTKLDSARLAHELTESKRKLEALFGVPVNFFCYPSGRFDPKVVAAVRAAHYLGATTTRYGDARPGEMYTMNRIRVSGGESLSRFAEQLTSAR